MGEFCANLPKSFLDYVLLPQLLPLVAALGLSMAIRVCGGGVFSVFLISFGCILAVVLFIILPIPILQPVGGQYHVGVTHVHSRQAQMMPPLAVFYPTNTSPHPKGISYLPFNDIRFFSGIASRGKIPLNLLRHLLFVRLKASEKSTPISLVNNNSNGVLPPVIVFSHGLYGYHRLYSCLLADLAARGAVVVSIGHCDGSASFMRDADDAEGKEGGGTGGKSVVHMKDVDWESSAGEEALAQRVVEVQQTLRRLREEQFWRDVGFAEEDIRAYMREPLRVHLVGHSFGGATALVAAMQEEEMKMKQQQQNGDDDSKKKEGESIVQSVSVFDPWHVPLQNEHFFLPIADGRKEYTTPTLMVHSDSWVRSKPSWDFFERVNRLILAQRSLASLSDDEKRTRFVTQKTSGTNHYSVSDIVILSPVLHGTTRAIVSPRVQIMEWSNLVLRFVKAARSVH